MSNHKWYAALAYARANKLNRIIWDSPRPKIGIITAGKSYLDTRQALADLGIDPSLVGLAAAWTTVVSFAKRPPRAQGQIVTDGGDGGTQLAEYLAGQKFL